MIVVTVTIISDCDYNCDDWQLELWLEYGSNHLVIFQLISSPIHIKHHLN